MVWVVQVVELHAVSGMLAVALAGHTRMLYAVLVAALVVVGAASA